MYLVSPASLPEGRGMESKKFYTMLIKDRVKKAHLDTEHITVAVIIRFPHTVEAFKTDAQPLAKLPYKVALLHKVYAQPGII